MVEPMDNRQIGDDWGSSRRALTHVGDVVEMVKEWNLFLRSGPHRTTYSII